MPRLGNIDTSDILKPEEVAQLRPMRSDILTPDEVATLKPFPSKPTNVSAYDNPKIPKQTESGNEFRQASTGGKLYAPGESLEMSQPYLETLQRGATQVAQERGVLGHAGDVVRIAGHGMEHLGTTGAALLNRGLNASGVTDSDSFEQGRVFSEIENQANREANPYIGGASEFAGNLADPIGLAAGAGVSKVAGSVLGKAPGIVGNVIAGKYGQAGLGIARSAAENAVGNVAITGAEQAASGEFNPKELAKSAAVGAVQGPLFHAGMESVGLAAGKALETKAKSEIQQQNPGATPDEVNAIYQERSLGAQQHPATQSTAQEPIKTPSGETKPAEPIPEPKEINRAENVRVDQGQVDQAGSTDNQSQIRGGGNLQPAPENTSVNAEAQQQAPQEVKPTVKENLTVDEQKFGPGAAGSDDPNFRVETGGHTVTAENAPKVVATTVTPEANAVRSTNTVGDMARGSWDSIKAKSADTYNAIHDSVSRLAQVTFPALKRADANSANAAATAVSTRELIHHQAEDLITRVLGRKISSVFDRLLGATLVEDQLKGIRAKFFEQYQSLSKKAQELSAKIGGASEAAKTQELADEALKNYKNVRTIVGAKDSPFKTEADYQAALSNPDVQAALAAHRQYVEPITENNYRLSSHLMDETLPPARGRDTNSHISLKAILEDKPEEFTQTGLKQGGNVRNTLEKHSPFEREARGTGENYELRYSELVKNSLEKGTVPAAQARLYKSLVDGGVAVYGKAGEHPTIDGKPTIGFDTKRQTIVNPESGSSFGNNKVLYVRSDVAAEVRSALNIDKPRKSEVLNMVAGLNTRITLLSGVEAIAHAANHFAVMFKEPIEGVHLPTWLANTPGIGKVAGILDAVGTNAYKMITKDPAVTQKLSKLAEIGALKPYNDQQVSKLNLPAQFGKVIDHLATASRVVLNDSFQMMADKGLVKDTPESRRDFVNQVGQYHKQAQGALVNTFRELGLGPFATAGTTFYTQGVRTLALSPGVKATSTANAVKLRAYVAMSLGGTLAQVALVNYLRTGQIQPKGTPWGSLYTGNNSEGKPRYIDVGDIIGAKRGARATGLDAAIEGYRNNQTGSQILDKGARQATSAAVGPFMGPAVSTVITGTTGYSPHGMYDVAGRAQPGESQTKRNLVTALEELNPSIGAFIENSERGGTTSDAVGGQLGKFAPRTGKNPASIPQSKAESYARELYKSQLPDTEPTEEQKAHSKAKNSLVDAIREKRMDEARKILSDNEFNAKDQADIVKHSKLSNFEYTITKLNGKNALKVYDYASPEQKDIIRQQVFEKMSRMQKFDDEDKKLIMKYRNDWSKVRGSSE